MSSLFIFGNGFDLAHGIRSQYLDFKSYLTKIYPDAENNSKNGFDLDDYLDKSEENYSIQLLFCAMENARGADWNNFEDALGTFNFHNKFPKRSKEAQEIDDKKDITSYLYAVDVISNILIQGTAFWQELFRKWVTSIDKEISKSIYSPRANMIKLFNEKDNQYLTFNYTRVLQKMYGMKKVIHIHNRVGQKLIFGHGDDDPVYKEPSVNDSSILSSFLDDMLLSFRKDTDSPLKKYNDFFRRLNKSVDKVYSYGFSYSKVDSVYIKKIISKISDKATWYFTDYEANNKKLIRIKKIKLRKYGFKGDFGVFAG